MKRNPLPPLSNGATYCTGPDGKRVCNGSQMGRRNILAADNTQPCKLRLVSMREANRTAYDSGGAYWGCYLPHLGDKQGGMWRAVGYVNDEDIPAMQPVEVYVRAVTREDAKVKVRALLPAARFYR